MLDPKKQSATTITHIVEISEEGGTLKDFLRDRYGISSRLLSKMKKKRQILMNGEYAPYHTRIYRGDQIEMNFEEDPNSYPSVPMNLEIAYEDLDLLIINKKPGIVTHPTQGHHKDTLTNGVVDYFQRIGLNMKVRFVNRLDMNTSGLLVIAKNPFAHFDLMKQMQEDQVTKSYLTWVHGKVKEDQGMIEEPIYNPEDSGGRRIIDSRGQISKTGYRVLRRKENRTLLNVRLYTGRTHQIRVHLGSIGHPIIGDTLYGDEGEESFPRQALHAFSLEFFQPRYRKKIQVEAPMPKDMEAL
ncbi:RluA family pseudouridine synthase [Isachenkonia alkalipeptolytica]|uniref:Pseudouridine synthase n=1 Tax=Isachenkonia alkalipeptolytica TaxID=2565777 RepID=A0AA43XIG5_9CLOT|nr:RluA family pseudouridine synthase [Isachenkonia alkalipeptolytica]NBG87046.1 RluA family pseudouridine synthase [Isachenkonia alkalipeptolytica]